MRLSRQQLIRIPLVQPRGPGPCPTAAQSAAPCSPAALGPPAAMHWLLGRHHHTHALGWENMENKWEKANEYEYELMTHENVFTNSLEWKL